MSAETVAPCPTCGQTWRRPASRHTRAGEITMRMTSDFGRRKCWCCREKGPCDCSAHAGDVTGEKCFTHTRRSS